MSEQEFLERWQQLDSTEKAEVARLQAEERARVEIKLQGRLESIADRVREAKSRDKAALIHEALTPDERGRHLKQERLAELTGMDQTSISHHGAFGHFQVYIGTPNIKPTLQTPLFFERLTLTCFLRLLQQTESQVGPRSAYNVRREDYERRFWEMVAKVNAGAGQPVTKEQITSVLETLATRKKPVPVVAIVQHLEQQHPDRTVDAKSVNVAIGNFKKRHDYLTEFPIDTAIGPAVRIRKSCTLDPVRAASAVEVVMPLLEEILELSGRSSPRTSLVQISANTQKVILALKELGVWADLKQR